MRYLFLIFISLFLGCGKKEGSFVKKKPSLLAKGSPGMNVWDLPEPGESEPLERAYEIAPPLIPHSIKDFVINREQNDCLDCHLEGVKISEEHVATRLSDFHFVNEYTGERQEKKVVGMKYDCVQCHAPVAKTE